MTDLRIEAFLTEGLGDSTYLVASGDEAALVDPQRDAWRFLEAAARRGWRITHVLETHVHNDYLSGALETRAATGAEIVAPARGRYAFAHRPADGGDEIAIGDLRIVARPTPGHTPEHLAWEIQGQAEAPDGAIDGRRPLAVLTGGSLLVGSAGRTDLLGPDLAPELAAAQFRTLRALAGLPDEVEVLPTHGAGSFCVAGPADARRITTIGDERRTNPLLAATDEAAFAEALVGSAGRWPAYYANMAPLNRAGPRLLAGLPTVPRLDPSAVEARVAAGARIVDARDRHDFAAAHIPGSLNVELGSSFASYVGWLVPFGTPLVLVVPEPAGPAIDGAIEALLRIGYDDVAGVLDGGIDTWRASGRPLRSYPTTTLAEVRDTIDGAAGAGRPAPLILDVRQPVEWRSGTLPGSTTIFVADLPGRLDELRGRGEVTVLCSSGLRASIAASLLDGAGIPVRVVAGPGLG